MPANAGIHAAPRTIGRQGLSLDSRVRGNGGFKKNGPSCPRTRASMLRLEPSTVIRVYPWIPASTGMTVLGPRGFSMPLHLNCRDEPGSQVGWVPGVHDFHIIPKPSRRVPTRGDAVMLVFRSAWAHAVNMSQQNQNHGRHVPTLPGSVMRRF